MKQVVTQHPRLLDLPHSDFLFQPFGALTGDVVLG